MRQFKYLLGLFTAFTLITASEGALGNTDAPPDCVQFAMRAALLQVPGSHDGSVRREEPPVDTRLSDTSIDHRRDGRNLTDRANRSGVVNRRDGGEGDPTLDPPNWMIGTSMGFRAACDTRLWVSGEARLFVDGRHVETVRVTNHQLSSFRILLDDQQLGNVPGELCAEVDAYVFSNNDPAGGRTISVRECVRLHR